MVGRDEALKGASTQQIIWKLIFMDRLIKVLEERIDDLIAQLADAQEGN